MAFSDAFNYFTSTGWKDYQAAGIAGNLYGESGLNPRAVGDSGLAYGVAQWHPDRQATFKRVMGMPITQSTAMQQYQFVNWELNNTEKKAGNILRSTTDVAGATYAFMRGYERPANDSSFGKRLSAAQNLLNGGLAKGVNTLKDKAKSIVNVAAHLNPATAPFALAADFLGINPLGGGDSCDWFCKLKKWIEETHIFQRIAIVVLALIVIAAAFYLLGNRTTLKMMKGTS
jgi:hypothetical protein